MNFKLFWEIIFARDDCGVIGEKQHKNLSAMILFLLTADSSTTVITLHTAEISLHKWKTYTKF